MKKNLALVLVVALTLTMIGCGKKDDNQETPESTQQNTTIEETISESAPESSVENTESVENTGDATPAEGTTGSILVEDFLARANEDAAISPQDMADALLTNSIIQFSGMTMAVEPGTLSGFSAEITDFESAVMFSPMIGSIPFVGYIFSLEEGADVDAFMETLNTNADPRWNICVEADETVVDHVGNLVFFLMCPSSIEE